MRAPATGVQLRGAFAGETNALVITTESLFLSIVIAAAPSRPEILTDLF